MQRERDRDDTTRVLKTTSKGFLFVCLFVCLFFFFFLLLSVD